MFRSGFRIFFVSRCCIRVLILFCSRLRIFFFLFRSRLRVLFFSCCSRLCVFFFLFRNCLCVFFLFCSQLRVFFLFRSCPSVFFLFCSCLAANFLLFRSCLRVFFLFRSCLAAIFLLCRKQTHVELTQFIFIQFSFFTILNMPSKNCHTDDVVLFKSNCQGRVTILILQRMISTMVQEKFQGIWMVVVCGIYKCSRSVIILPIKNIMATRNAL